MKIVLASASPRRRELLSSMGIVFEVQSSTVEELLAPGETVEEYVRRLATEKGAEVASARPEDWIIAADTVVYLDGEVLEKPADPEHARRMLKRIAGREHTVYTGLTLQRQSDGWLDCRMAISSVTIAPMSSEDIGWYVSTGEPMDKAGAYAVQGIGAMFIESVHGSYTNVVGLPLATLLKMMRRAGIDPIGTRIGSNPADDSSSPATKDARGHVQ